MKGLSMKFHSHKDLLRYLLQYDAVTDKIQLITWVHTDIQSIDHLLGKEYRAKVIKILTSKD